MRLIDADAINFEEIFGGQSDFAKDIRDAVQGLIDKQPTVFEKEKVKMEINENKDIDNLIDVDHAIYIIEKGGIE